MLLWPAASPNKKGPKLDISNLATRGQIWLMPDEDPVAIRIEGKQPSITVGTVVNLSSPNGHDNSLLILKYKIACRERS